MWRTVDITEATRSYERWLGARVPLLRGDLDLKHRLMSTDAFSFLRATFYRWAQQWPEICEDCAGAPAVLAVGDLHVENFGTWRDAEGRLIWGINDFDEVVALPYTQDLVRLATSALIAVDESRLTLSGGRACEALLEGYAVAARGRGRGGARRALPLAARPGGGPPQGPAPLLGAHACAAQRWRPRRPPGAAAARGGAAGARP